MTSHEVTFQPVGRRAACGPDQSLLGLAQELGVDLISLCGGNGQCGRCRVQIVSGQVTEPTEADEENLSDHELDEGFRLACQTFPESPLTVGVPPESLSTAMRTQIESRETNISVVPTVHTYALELPRPSLEHPLADADSLLAVLRQTVGPGVDTVDIGVLQHLSPDLRAWDWRCTASVRGSEVIAIGPPGSRPIGLAVDLGTTGVAGYLVDLERGEVLAARGMMNPQIKFGEDVISRITFARTSPESRKALQQVAVEGLNGLTAGLCGEAGLTIGDVVEAAVVGNTAMHHLLLGLPTEQLALAEVRSPAAGIVATPARQLRELTRQFVPKGALIAKVYDLEKLTVEIAVPEREVADVNVGQPVALKARAYPDETFRGTVTSIATTAQAGAPAPGGDPRTQPPASGGSSARTVLVTTEIDNPSLLLKPGMSGQAKISCGERRVRALVMRRVARTVKVQFWSWW